jgi:dephospho-CoA kinase
VTPIVRLGLTGGIGSGKSSVARMLADRGAAVVDADAIARDLTAPGGLALPLITATFGAHVITPTGALDREKMRLLAFADPAARKRLEAIIHPLVGQEANHQAMLAANEGRSCTVFDIPLLVESGSWRQKVDHVLVVDCTPEVQISRVMARNQLTRAEISKIIASQSARGYRLRAADTVIFNVGLSLAELAAEVGQISPCFGLSSIGTWPTEE